MSEEKKEINPLIVNQHNALIKLIEFTKNRQWAITNYSVLIYAGIFGVAYIFDNPGVRLGEKIALCVLVGLTLGCAIWLLLRVQGGAGEYRHQLEQMNDKLLSPEEKDQFGFQRYINPALHGKSFLLALMGVVFIGAGLVIYSILRT